MKMACGKVPRHDQLVAVGLSLVTAAVSWRIGAHYGWKDHNPDLADTVATVWAYVGFAVALLCVISVPLNKVHIARMAVGALFVSFAYAGALMIHGLETTDRVSRVALYLFVAVVAFPWHSLERDITLAAKDLGVKL